MTFRARLQRLERSDCFVRGCLACRDRRGYSTLVTCEQRADGTVTEPKGMPEPCVQCGQVAERIIKLIEEIVISPAAVGDEAEDMQAGESLVEVIGGGPDID
jgi:hypothetical protein